MMAGRDLVATNKQRMLAWRALVELIVRCAKRTCTRAVAFCRVTPRLTAADTVGAGARTGAASVMMAGRALVATNQQRMLAWRALVELIAR